MQPTDSETRFELVPFFHGKILDISEGSSKAFPHFISHIDLGITDPHQVDIFADKSLDGILSSYLLHLFDLEECRKALEAWKRIVKPGGYLMLHLPKGHEKERWEVSRESVGELVGEPVHVRERENDILLIFGKDYSRPNGKSCAVVRLGAFGDCIQASSILPWLKSQGYHITFYCSDHGMPVIEHDPHIDRFIIQGRDEVPPSALGDFWNYESKKYDRWINLSESVEGTLLAAPGSTRFYWPNEVRAKHMDVNYLEFTHEIAQVPPPYLPKFYSTPEERAWAKDKARSYGRTILWSLSGSSVHKAWPHLDAVVARLMIETDLHVVFVGDEVSQVLEAGWQEERRVHKFCGKWSIRQSMAFAEVADLIIGTETGLLNAAGSMDTPKIVTLSHSSEEMLTKYWKNTTVLTQPKGVGCPKQPCRQLHTDWSDCMKHEDGTAYCQHFIGPEVMFNAIQSVLSQRKAA